MSGRSVAHRVADNLLAALHTLPNCLIVGAVKASKGEGDLPFELAIERERRVLPRETRAILNDTDPYYRSIIRGCRSLYLEQSQRWELDGLVALEPVLSGAWSS